MFYRFLPILLGGLLTACDAVPTAKVSHDWSETIADLGLTAIYPVREDFNVGDLLVAAQPKPEGDENARTFGRLSVGSAGSPSSGKVVALPTISLSADDAAKLGLGGILASVLGLSASRDDQVSITLAGTKSVEIDDSTAWSLLSSACQPGSYLAVRQGAFDGSARSFGAWSNARRPGYLTIVTTVYYVSGVNYQLTDAGGESASASTTSGGPDSASAKKNTSETLDKTFAKPLAFAYDGFAVQADAPGTLC